MHVSKNSVSLDFKIYSNTTQSARIYPGAILKIHFHTLLSYSTNSLVFCVIPAKKKKVAVLALVRLPRESYNNSLKRLGLRGFTLSPRLSEPASKLLKGTSKRIFPLGLPLGCRVKQILVPCWGQEEQSISSHEETCCLSTLISRGCTEFTLRLPR